MHLNHTKYQKSKRMITEPHPLPFSSSFSNFATSTPQTTSFTLCSMKDSRFQFGNLGCLLTHKKLPEASIDQSIRSKRQNRRQSIQHDLDSDDAHDLCQDQRQRRGTNISCIVLLQTISKIYMLKCNMVSPTPLFNIKA